MLAVLKSVLNTSLNKTDKCMYVKYVYHILLITNIFWSLSQSSSG